MPATPKTLPASRRLLPLLAVSATLLLGACADRDTITVGSVPDDYRLNHPIAIGEKEEVVDLAVATGDRRASRPQREALAGFLDRYDRSAAPVLRIMPPAGALNSRAALAVARDLAAVAEREGVPAKRIVIASYDAGAADAPAPLRLAFWAVRAQTGPCGQWPEDILKSSSTENKHYPDFGCSYQNNMAAQIANPNDLVTPRKQTTIDAENRGRVIDDYRGAPASDTFVPSVEY